MNYRILAAMFAFLLLGAVLTPRANADEDQQSVKFTTNAPLEVPGRVLPAGHYVIRLQGNGGSVAGLWNASGTKFYGYFDTIPVSRYRGISKPEVDFSKMSAGNPERLKEWFVPGNSTGHELLYPAHSRYAQAQGYAGTH